MHTPIRPSKSRNRFGSPMSDINVTPFVDVMLVLLVVFMITAPLLAPSVDVASQSQATPPPLDTPPEHIRIHANKSLIFRGRTYYGNQIIPLLKERTNANPRLKIHIDPDCDALLALPMTLIANLIQDGIPQHQIALVTKPCGQPKGANHAPSP